MNYLRYTIICGLGMLLLAACATSPQLPTATALTAAPTATLKPSSTPTSAPTSTRTPRPALTAILPSPTPTATRIACNLDSPYLGVSHPGHALYLVDIQGACIARIQPSHSSKVYGWGSWLTDGSGFVYLDGNRDGTAINICLWSLAKQMTTRCLLEDVDDYMQAVWSPDDTNLVAYRRFDVTHEKEFVTIASTQSGKVLYKTEQNSASSSSEERFLAWNPDGKQVLLAVEDGSKQQAVLVDVTSHSRQDLAKFDGSKEYLATLTEPSHLQFTG